MLQCVIRNYFRSLVLLVLPLLFLPACQEAGAGHLDHTERIIELTNIERQKAGLRPLSANPQLRVAARTYAETLVEHSCWSHTCGSVPQVEARAEAAGYADWVTVGENLAAGQRTPEAVVTAWMASPAHRANILDPRYTEIGVARALGGRQGIYWAQEFGTRALNS